MERDELHRRVMILKEELEAGRLNFVPDLQVLNALGEVRYASDGKVDPETVDASVRALASGVAFLRQHEELKRVPLLEVQRAYFDLLELFFGRPFSEMKRHNVSPHAIATGMASTESLVSAWANEAEQFASRITEFWTSFGPVVYAHLQDMRCLKAVYGGDFFPSYTANIACSVGLYVDTIVLPDPLLRAAPALFPFMKPERSLYYIAKHALNALRYRDIALADVEPPIVVIAPNNFVLDPQEQAYVRAAGEADLIEHCSRLFGRKFASAQRVESFLARLKTVDAVQSSIADPSRLLFDVEWAGTPAEQIQRFEAEVLAPNFASSGTAVHPGKSLWLALSGRMMQTSDVLLRSYGFGGTPIMDAPTSWQYLLWKYEYDRDRGQRLFPDMDQVLLTKALQAEGDQDLGIISGLPPDALIDLRRQGALTELRETIRAAIAEINTADPSALAEVGEAVATTLGEALSRHKREVAAMAASKRRFFGLEVGPWVGVGAISIAAASAANVPLSLLAAAGGLVGVPSAKDLWKHGKEIIAADQELKRSPAGILFRHLERKAP